MKKILFLIAAFVLAFVTSYAQTEKGTQTVGLNFQFQNTSTKGAVVNSGNTSSNQSMTTKSLDIGPQYSYFIENNLALGGSLTYMSSSYAYPPNSDVYNNSESQKNYGASVYLRKYFMYKDKIGLRVGPMIGYSHGNQTQSYVTPDYSDVQKTKTDTWDASLTAEVVYYPTKHLGVSAVLANAGYSYSNYSEGALGSNTKYTYLNFINNGLSLSVFYSFGGK